MSTARLSVAVYVIATTSQKTLLNHVAYVIPTQDWSRGQFALSGQSTMTAKLIHLHYSGRRRPISPPVAAGLYLRSFSTDTRGDYRACAGGRVPAAYR